MIFVDRFTVDDSVVEARDFLTDSKAFTNINPTLLMNTSDKNLMNHSDDGDEFVSNPVPSCHITNIFRQRISFTEVTTLIIYESK